MNITNLTPQQLRKAADLQERIVALQSELIGILGSPIPVKASDGDFPHASHQAKSKKRGMSAAGRAAISAAAKARWAKVRGEKSAVETQAAAKSGKKKGKISAAGRKALSENLKARWAAKKAAGKAKL
jgi:hypothetical protein